MDVLERLDRTDEAEQMLISQAEAGDPDAMWRLGEMLTRQGRTEEAFHWIRVHAEAGAPLAVSRMAAALVGRGDRTGAERLLRQHAEAGVTSAMWHLGEFLVKYGDLNEAITWLQRSAAEDPIAEQLILKTCSELDRVADAESPLRARHDKGNWSATEHFAEALLLLDRSDEAELLLRWMIEARTAASMMRISEPYGMRQLTELLGRTGRSAEAARLHAYGIQPGGETNEAFDLPKAPDHKG